MDFASFILVNAALFIRPSEIAPALATVPIYLILILACLAISSPKIIAQWTTQSLSGRPVTACMLGLLLSVVMSHLARFDVGLARWWGLDFAKIVLYYLLLVAVVDTPSRLRGLLIWLVILIAAMTTLALCQYHKIVDIPTLTVLERPEEDPRTGEIIYILQLVGTGIFNDPNDFALILSMGCLMSLYLADDRAYGPLRVLWLGFTGLFGYATVLTQSRGGFLALSAGLLVLLVAKVGTKRGVIAAAVLGAVALPLLGGRLSRMSTGEDTAQQRIELWREALLQFRQSPLFGIGANTFADQAGLVAHNSYVHCYAEMGFMGGTWFVGTFFFAAMILRKIGRVGASGLLAPEMNRMRPFLLSILVTFIVGLYSITRCYAVSTYLPMGLVEIYQNVSLADHRDQVTRVTPASLVRMGAASLVCLAWLFVFIRLAIH